MLKEATSPVRTASDSQCIASDDSRLADAIEAGDEAAVREFVTKYERLLMSICLRMLRHRQEAEDVVQDSFFRVLRALPRWDRSRPIVPWLTTITMNRCRTALERRQRRPTPIAVEADSLVDSGTPDAAVEQREERAAIAAAVEQLPTNWREAFKLHYGVGLSCEEVADTLGCAVGTVKTWLFRGRRRLGEQLATHEVEATGGAD